MSDDEELIEVRARVPSVIAAVLDLHAKNIARFKDSRERLIGEILNQWYEEQVHTANVTVNRTKEQRR